MAEKHYNRDWAKEKSRDLVRDMIQKTLLKFRRPKDIRVLCLPGRDSQEVIEVYDRLGIPRQNIVGVEMIPRYAQEAQANAPGIQVVNKTLEDYVSQAQTIDFDVFSLDYTGPITMGSIKLATNLLYRNLNRNVIFHQANLAKRDPDSNRFYAYSQFEEKRYNLTTSILSNPVDTINLFSTTLNECEEEFKTRRDLGEDPTLLKSKGLDFIASRLGWFGHLEQDAEAINKLLRFSYSQNFEQLVNQLKEIGREIYGPSFNVDPNNIVSSFPERRSTLLNIAMIGFINECKQYGLKDPEQIDLLLQPFMSGERRSFCLDRQTYSYISESGSPMIGFIGNYARNYKLFNLSEEAKFLVGFPDYLHIDEPLKLAKTLRKLGSIREELYKVINREAPTLFLGNSSRPVLTKQRFIQELKSGISPEEIRSKYRGWENKPLAQWQAHYTMGTYGKTEVSEDVAPETSPEDSDLERITKEDALELLSSGIPVDEIASAYPTSFSVGQLRAFKAHLTMGRYSKE
jgi:uncharacterized protein (DUF433 family)